MQKLKAVVTKIMARPWGDKTFYSLSLEGQDKFFGVGEKLPDVKEGAEIEFVYTINNKGYPQIDTDTIKFLGFKTVAPQQNRPTNRGQKSAGPAQSYDSRQNNITWQSARNAGIEFLKLAFEQGALKMPGKVADRYEVLQGMLLELTEQFYKEANVQASVRNTETFEEATSNLEQKELG